MSNLKNIVHAAIEKDSVSLKEAVTAELNERIVERINDMREGVANALFGNEVVESEESDEELDEDADLDEEELDEVSKKTLGSYIKKSKDDVGHIQRDITRVGTKSDEYKDLARMRKNRKTGIDKAVDRLTKEEVEDLEELSVDKVDAYRYASHKDKKPREKGRQLAFAKVTGRAKVNATPSKKNEEVEELDEISKKTLGSYVKKATTDVKDAAFKVGKNHDMVKNMSKAIKRTDGINKAVDRLSKDKK